MFKYCAFYGISSPMILMFSERDIKDITALKLTSPAAHLLQSLQYECLKLKDILMDNNTIVMEEDTTSPVIQNFIAGLNSNLNNNGNTNLPKSVTGVELGRSSFFTKPQQEYTGDKISIISLENLNTWELSSDLVGLGKSLNGECTGKFRNIQEIKRYLAFSAKGELSEKDYTSLAEQFKKLPRIPSGRILSDGKVYMLKEDHPKLYTVLKAIHKQAFSMIGKQHKIDFIIEHIEKCLVQSELSTAKFFSVPYDTLRTIGSIYACNRTVNEAVVKGPISTSAKDSKAVIIDNLIYDCDVLLGNTSKATSVDLTAKPYKLSFSGTSITELVRNILSVPELMNAHMLEYEDDLNVILSSLSGTEHCDKFLTNSDELVLLAHIHFKLAALERGAILAEYGLDADVQLEELNDIGTKVAKVLKIGGVYFGYITMFFDTIRIVNNAIKRTSFKLSPSAAVSPFNDIYTNIGLVKRHLKSMKARLKA